MKKQTAVEWLVEALKQINTDFDLGISDEHIWSIKTHEAIQQAKEMEREQIEEAYQMGREGLTITEFNETFEP
jgi:methylthioribose-1-phosphate isomerase